VTRENVSTKFDRNASQLWAYGSTPLEVSTLSAEGNAGDFGPVKRPVDALLLIREAQRAYPGFSHCR